MRKLSMNKALTPRETEVARLWVSGVVRRKAIAKRMNLSADGVHFHVDNLLDKLDARSVPEAIVKLFRDAGARSIVDAEITA